MPTHNETVTLVIGCSLTSVGNINFAARPVSNQLLPSQNTGQQLPKIVTIIRHTQEISAVKPEITTTLRPTQTIVIRTLASRVTNQLVPTQLIETRFRSANIRTVLVPTQTINNSASIIAIGSQQNIVTELDFNAVDSGIFNKSVSSTLVPDDAAYGYAEPLVTLDGHSHVSKNVFLENFNSLDPVLLWQANTGGFGVGVPVVDNTNVVDWQSRVGNVTLTQATPSKRPIYLQTGIGNQPSLIFDGGDFLPGSATPIASDTVGAVIICFRQAVTTGEQCMLSVYNNSITADTISFSISYGKLLLVHQSGSGQPIGIVFGHQLVGLGMRVATFLCNSNGAGGWSLYLDNVLQTLTTSSSGNIGKWFGDTPGINMLSIGCERSNGASAFKGEIAWLGIWNRVLA